MASTDDQRDAAIRAAVEAIAMAQKTLVDLGVVATPKARDPRARSPDGGPLSEAHTYLKAHRVPTMKVHRLDADGKPLLEHGEIMINVSAFNEEFHVAVDTKRARSRAQIAEEVEEDDEPVTSRPSPSRSDLSMMSMSNLRAQPEVSSLTEVPKDKTELVDAILAAR